MKKFNEEEITVLEDIIQQPKEKWNDLLKELAKISDRSFGSVWQKAYAMSLGNKERKKRRNRSQELQRERHKKKPSAKKAPKKAAVKKEKIVPPRPYKRKSHKSPLIDTYMTVSPNEVRFPIQSIRIEGGELIVTFK